MKNFFRTYSRSKFQRGSEKMQEWFKKLEEKGKNTGDNLILWMKEAKVVIDKASEDAARKIMKAEKDQKVTWERFSSAVQEAAERNRQTAQQYQKQLAESQFAGALKAGWQAFEEHMKKK
ncbi:uncharacterized protein LOC105388806 isoform X2 [Plutella xylostella]|nr:uncharacterized protein LOC105388806 isoform X2 [Plutella xylostella]